MAMKSGFKVSVAAFVIAGCCASTAYAQTTTGKTQQPAQVAAPPAAAATPAAPAATPALGTAEAQHAAAPTAVAPPAAAPAPAAAPPAPPAATAAPVAVVPPGYALVPVEGSAQTRYEVEYPQHQGALPPGMELPYEDGDPIPDGYRVVKQSRRGLVIAGSIVGGIAYGFSILGAVEDDFNHKSGSLLVPVVGPWLMLALGGAKNVTCDNTYYGTSSTCGDRSGLRTMLVLDGLMQAAGATMLTLGIALPRTRLVRRDVTVSMLPMPMGRDGYGLGAVGQF